MIRKSKLRRAIILAIGCIFFANGEAAVFTFSQDGFEGGGVVTGTFVGEDLNGDGLIDFFDLETLGVSLEWSGNALVPAHSAPLNPFNGFIYDLALGEFRNTGFTPPPVDSSDFSGSGGLISVFSDVWWFAGEAFTFIDIVPTYGNSHGVLVGFTPTGEPIELLTNNPTVVTQVVPIPSAWLLLLSAVYVLRRDGGNRMYAKSCRAFN